MSKEKYLDRILFNVLIFIKINYNFCVITRTEGTLIMLSIPKYIHS